MKVLSKGIIGVVALFSLWSCGKGTKVSKEKFIEKAEEINSNDSYKQAKFTYVLSATFADGKKENRKYASIYVKENGSWVSGSDKNDAEADSLYYFYFDKLDPNSIESSVRFDSNLQNEKETYYIRPFAYEYSYEATTVNTRTEIVKQNYYTYYEWDDYGYLTYLEIKDDQKDINAKSTVRASILKIKITYK